MIDAVFVLLLMSATATGLAVGAAHWWGLPWRRALVGGVSLWGSGAAFGTALGVWLSTT